MAKAYDIELKKKAFELRDSGKTLPSIANSLGVSYGFILNLFRRFKTFEDCKLQDDYKKDIAGKYWKLGIDNRRATDKKGQRVDPLTIEIDEMIENGLPASTIASITGSSETYINLRISRLLEKNNDNGIVIGRLGPGAEDPACVAPNVVKIEDFRDNRCHIGSKIKILKSIPIKVLGITKYKKEYITCTVLEKYPFVCRTDKGDFQYFDLYMGTMVND